jgi:hypothetical protein
LRYVTLARSPEKRMMGVDAAESMSMKRESGIGPAYVALSDQSPWRRS